MFQINVRRNNMESDINDGKEIELINKLLTEDRELLELSTRLQQFNPFKILRITDYEIRHSNFLAWILNPEETHGLGDKFLRHFLSSWLQYNSNQGREIPVTPATAQLSTIADVTVEREKYGIDILIEIPTMNWIIVIENKVHSKESPTQLNEYYKKIKERYCLDEKEDRDESKWKFLGVYLTIDGALPENSKHYFPFEYKEIREDLRQVMRLNNNISIQVSSFLNNYLDILDELTINEKDTEYKLAKSIYGKHQEILEIIRNNWESTTDPQAKIYKRIYYKHELAIKKALEFGQKENLDRINKEIINKEEDMELSVLHSTRNSTIICPEEWIKLLKGKFNGLNYKNKNEDISIPMVIWFSHAPERKIGVIIEIGPVDSPDERMKFVTIFDKLKGLELRNYSVTDKSKWTRLYSNYIDNNKSSFHRLWFGTEKKDGGVRQIVNKITEVLKDSI